MKKENKKQESKKLYRIAVTGLTATSMAVTLGACGGSQSEFVQMVNNSEAIEIEVATPSAEQEQGTAIQLDWTQLDQLQTQPTLRKEMDTLFKIVPYGDNSKNGVFYIDLEGNQNGNNTLYNTFANSSFRQAWRDENTQESLASLATENYADIEADNISEACLAALNGYFNILEDAEGYANMDSTITRLEAMSAIFKAENPVTDKLAEDTEFNKAVDPDNSNYNTIYASNLSEQSYLDITSQSLDTLTANGTITRGELAYLIVQQYFLEDYNKVDVKTAEVYDDVTNAGNIAEKNKATDKPHWQAYELTYCLQNPSEGCPERMYKALAVAKEKGIIDGTDSRWDEGATKGDLLEMLTNAYLYLAPQTKDTLGKGDGEALEIENTKAEETKDETTTGGGSMGEDDIDLSDDEYTQQLIQAEEEAKKADETLNTSEGIEIVEELDIYLYVQKSCNARTGDGTNYEQVTQLEVGAKPHITGRTANDWYRIEWGDGVVYASSQFFGEADPLASSKVSEEESNAAADDFDQALQQVYDQMGGYSTPPEEAGRYDDPSNKEEGAFYYSGGTEAW